MELLAKLPTGGFIIFHKYSILGENDAKQKEKEFLILSCTANPSLCSND